MTEETQKPESAPAPSTKEVVVVEEKGPIPVPEAAEKEKEKLAPAAVEEETAVESEKAKHSPEEAKIPETVSFKEETNIVGELPDAQKKALDELKLLIQEALHKHEFTAPPPPPPKEEPEKTEEKVGVEEKTEEPKTEEELTPQPAEPDVEEKVEKKMDVKEEEKVRVEVEVEEDEKNEEAPVEAEEVVETLTAVDEDGAKTVEAIEETIVAVSFSSAAPAPAEEPAAESVAEPKEKEVVPGPPPPPPEEVFIWGIPLLGEERSNVILLKFLRARDFKVKDAFAMIKNTIMWRKKFGIDALLEEDLGHELEKAVFMHGFDKEGHPVCYNVYGAFQDKELYQNCFADEEKRVKFLRWRIQLLERSIRKLDFSPSGICTIVQVNDLKNSPGPAKRELRQATNQALGLLQDNYPEFVAKQVFINVPWWYLAFHKMISPFLTQRTKSKFVFAGPSKSAETLFRYIAPEQVPVQYGGLSREGEQEFSIADCVTEVTLKPAAKHTVEFAVSENCLLVWEVRVVGWEVSYEAEFVPIAKDGYTVIVSKSRKVTPFDEPVICDNFKIGEAGKVVLAFDNQTSKRKKLLYRFKTKLLIE